MHTPYLFGALTRYAALAAELDENGGVLSDELAARLTLTQATLDTRGAELLALYTQAATETAGIDAEIARLTKQKAAHGKLKAAIESGLDALVRTVGPLTIGTHKLALRRSERTVVDTLPELLPAAYQRVIPAKVEADKTAIKNAIKAGENIIGCAVEECFTLQIK